MSAEEHSANIKTKEITVTPGVYIINPAIKGMDYKNVREVRSELIGKGLAGADQAASVLAAYLGLIIKDSNNKITQFFKPFFTLICGKPSSPPIRILTNHIVVGVFDASLKFHERHSDMHVAASSAKYKL